MEESPMKCTSCGSYNSFEDGFCKACGVEDKVTRLPVKREETLPDVWRQAAPVLARGAALVLAGIAAEWLMRAATRKALSVPFNGRKPKKSRAVAKRETPARPTIVAFSETVVTRRLIVRREG
jgi:hypothetical protein